MGFVQDFPGNTFSNDTLRLRIFAKEIVDQDLKPKNNTGHIVVGGDLYDWNLVAPSDLQENIQHTWEEYSSFQGRAAQMISDTVRSFASLSQVGGGISRSSGSTKPAMAKVDSPMVYVGSKRLEYSITIPFMRYRRGAFADVFQPIHEFRKLSCASFGKTTDTVNFPAIFEIYTEPANFLYIQFAALTDVQTKYEAPFVLGYPQRAECTLTFMDIQPLYRESWMNGLSTVTSGIVGGGGH
jgi:hypothetical protein